MLADPSRELSDSAVRRFGMVWSPMFIGVLVALRVLPPALLALAFLSIVVTWAKPAATRLLLRLWGVLTWPLALVASWVLLGVTYFLVFAPLGAVARALGHDPLQRKQKGAESTWRPLGAEPTKKSYFDSF